MKTTLDQTEFTLIIHFIQLLNRNNCFNNFVCNLIEYSDITLASFLWNTNPPDFVSGAFHYLNTSKDDSFWSSIEKKWATYLNQINYKL